LPRRQLHGKQDLLYWQSVGLRQGGHLRRRELRREVRQRLRGLQDRVKGIRHLTQRVGGKERSPGVSLIKLFYLFVFDSPGKLSKVFVIEKPFQRVKCFCVRP
jgi:hypothetical protein